jgi:hypothetical protein
MAYSSPFEELFDESKRGTDSFAAGIADAARKIRVRGARAGEAPADTEKRFQAEQKLKAEDFEDRGVPTFRDTTGEVRPVTDESGQALSGFDKPSSIGFDSQGQPKKIGSDPVTGAPSLSDPFAGVPVKTDKAGNRSQQVGPAYRWLGMDEKIVADRKRTETNEALRQAVAATGGKLTADKASLVLKQKEHKKLVESFASEIPGLEAGDTPEAVDKKIDAHFNAVKKDLEDSGR